MRNYLEKKRGQKMRIIIEQNSQKQPVHYYEGELITLAGDAIILKEAHLGDIAINPELIVAVQILEPTTPSGTALVEGTE